MAGALTSCGSPGLGNTLDAHGQSVSKFSQFSAVRVTNPDSFKVSSQ